MNFLKRLHVNIFTMLVVAAALGILFRAVNIITFNNGYAPAITSAEAEDHAPKASSEEPPPLKGEASKSDVQKSVDQTVKGLGETSHETKEHGTEGAAKEEGPDSIKPPSGMPADTSSEQRSFSASEIEVLQSLAKRRDDLDKREKTLATREALLTAAEEEVDRKVAELNKLRDSIQKLLGQQQEMEDSRINSLVKIYESMKPKEAATIFNTLDMDVLLSVISRMKEAKSSPVLAAMDPEKARIVTIRLAEQRKLPTAPALKKTEAPAAAPPAEEPATP